MEADEQKKIMDKLKEEEIKQKEAQLREKQLKPLQVRDSLKKLEE